MQNRNLAFIWSLGWWFEGNKAWFIDDMEDNMLFSVDLITGECEKVIHIPNSDKWKYRLNPYCIKCDRDIFCIPGYGKSIWIYNLDDNSFTELEIEKPDLHQIGSQFWKFGDTILIVAGNWNKVIEISIAQKAITNYYTICENDTINGSVLVGKNIYAISSEVGRIYRFNIITKKVNTYLLSDFDKRLFTICYDGEKFWLSGYQKEVYIWDKENNDIITLDCSFGSFGFKSADKKEDGKTGNNIPVFNRSISVGEYIWFIPIQGQKIMYANKKTGELFLFELYDEDKMSILSKKAYGIADYMLQYVRDNRYLGLFSAKCRRIFEIDTKQLSYQWMEYRFSDKWLNQHVENCKGVYVEGKEPLALNIQAYGWGICEGGNKRIDSGINNVGMKIYKTIKEKN